MGHSAFSSFEMLPTEIIEEIFSYLTPLDTFKCTRGCTRLQNIALFVFRKSSLLVDQFQYFIGENCVVDCDFVSKKTAGEMIEFFAPVIETVKLNLGGRNRQTIIINWNGYFFRSTWNTSSMKFDIFSMLRKCCNIVSLALDVYEALDHYQLFHLFKENKNLKQLKLSVDDTKWFFFLIGLLPKSLEVIELNRGFDERDVIKFMRTAKSLKKIGIWRADDAVLQALTTSSQSAKRVKTLIFHESGWESPIPMVKDISRLVNLEHLHIKLNLRTPVDDVVPGIVSRCTRIRKLSISGGFSDSSTSEITSIILTHLPKLEELNFYEMNLQQLLPKWSQLEASNLRALSIKSCKFLKEYSLLLFVVEKAPKLKSLRVDESWSPLILVEFGILLASVREINCCVRNINQKFTVSPRGAGNFSQNTFDLIFEGHYYSIMESIVLMYSRVFDSLVMKEMIPFHQLKLEEKLPLLESGVDFV